MKGFIICLLCLVITAHAAIGEENEKNGSPEGTQTPAPNTAPPAGTKQVPNIKAKRNQFLIAQYPQSDIKRFKAGSETFTALWRRDTSGNAFGAVLIVPADGQTANWPNTIDVLRTDLPLHGWNTLSIDIRNNMRNTIVRRTNSAVDADTDADAPSDQAPSDQVPSDQVPSNQVPSDQSPDNNVDRIEAAIDFLHTQGQYNIVLAGYGNSAARILHFTKNTIASSDDPAENKKKIRALILVNPLNHDGTAVSHILKKMPTRDMPIFDLVLGTHLFDTFDAQARKRVARENDYKTYYQLRLLEPTVEFFTYENRLSRRIRGFLNHNAKGVEVAR